MPKLPSKEDGAPRILGSSDRGASKWRSARTDAVQEQALQDGQWQRETQLRPSAFSQEVDRALHLASAVGSRVPPNPVAEAGHGIAHGSHAASSVPPSPRSHRALSMRSVSFAPTIGSHQTEEAADAQGLHKLREGEIVEVHQEETKPHLYRGRSQIEAPAPAPETEAEVEAEADVELDRVSSAESEEWEGQMPAHRRRAAALTTRVSYLLEFNGLSQMSLCSSSGSRGGIYNGLGPATFQDRRWENAMDYLRPMGLLESRQRVQDLLRRGAQSFGIWSVSDATLEALVRHVLEQDGERRSEPRVSPPLECWLREREEAARESQSASRGTSAQTMAGSMSLVPKTPRRSGSVTSQAVKDFKAKRHSTIGHTRMKMTLFFMVLIVSCGITIPWKPTPLSTMFGPGLVIARITGVGTLLWTAVLFLSMSRTLIKSLYECLQARSRVARALDANEEIHKYCGKMVFVFGLVHTCAHLLSTYRKFSQASYQTLNGMLNCASDENRLLRFLEWPPCPLQRQHGYYELIISLTGLTGFFLLAVVALMGYTAVKKARKENFEFFQFVHNVGMVLFIVLLFLHGSQGWFGLGIPLVLPFCIIPVGIYGMDRVLRLLRYYLFKGHNITSAVIRAGKKGGPDGALTFLQIAKPPHLWNFRAGMYAFINLPEYSLYEWHPFTIVSGKEDDTVDFIVAGVGDWTRALAQKCLDYKHELRPEFPMIAMDGPYAAPVTTALNCHVLVAVGAGVGVTPFLALMSRIVAMVDDGEHDDLKEVHFFWITRSADEYLFGRRHFTRIVSDERLRQKFFFHLHLTLKEQDNDAPAYIFREAVARQSQIDRQAFMPAVEDLTAQDLGPSGLQVPCGWLHGAERHDIFWVSSLVEAEDEKEEEEIAEAYTNHWAEGAESSAATSSAVGMASCRTDNSEEPPRKKCSGPLLSRRQNSRDSSGSGRSGSTGQMRNSGSKRTALSSDIGSVPEHCAEIVVDVGSQVSMVESTVVRSLLPIAFGRPDFLTEIQSVGKAWPAFDVDVYVCGNDLLTDSIRDICRVCTAKSVEGSHNSNMGFNVSRLRPQRFNFRCENFS